MRSEIQQKEMKPSASMERARQIQKISLRGTIPVQKKQRTVGFRMRNPPGLKGDAI